MANLRLISQIRAQEARKLESLSSWTLIEVASEWINDHWQIGTYTTDSDDVSEDVEPTVQQAAVQMVLHLTIEQELDQNQKRRKEKLGEYEIELEWEVTISSIDKYADVTRLMQLFPRLPLKYAPRWA